jgi:hypothetical protein
VDLRGVFPVFVKKYAKKSRPLQASDVLAGWWTNDLCVDLDAIAAWFRLTIALCRKNLHRLYLLAISKHKNYRSPEEECKGERW